MMKRFLFLASLFALALGAAALFLRPAPSHPLAASPTNLSELKVPKAISSPDFQRFMDRELILRLKELERSKIMNGLDKNFVKPFLDDLQTRSMTMDGLEVTTTQFPALNAIVIDCAKILHIERIPRVFIVERPSLLLTVENFSEPVVLINTTVLRRFKNPAELRFLIGREFGHIQAGHTRWQSLARKVQACLERADFTHSGATRLALLPIFQWMKEAEMTADNAGLVCSQDINAAERAIVRLATGIDDFTLREINVEEYLQQARTQTFSEFSDLALRWKEFNRSTPFAQIRIKQLREFAASSTYRKLWE